MSQESDRELSQLYRAGAGEEPPAWLDQRIQAAARKELRSSLVRRFIDALPRWQWVAGAMAVVTLSVSLVTLMKEESPSVLNPAASVAPSAEPRPSEQPARSAIETERADIAERARRQEQSRAVSGRVAEAESQRGEDHVDPRVQQARAARETAQVAKMDAEVAKTAEARPPAPPPAEPPAVAAAPATVPAAVPRSDEVRPPSDAGEPSGLGRMARKEAPPARAVAPRVTEENPEAWLKRLSEWMQQGREQEVRAELQRFRQRHPEFPLPDELRRLLPPASPAGTPPATSRRDPHGASP